METKKNAPEDSDKQEDVKKPDLPLSLRPVKRVAFGLAGCPTGTGSFCCFCY